LNRARPGRIIRETPESAMAILLQEPSPGWSQWIQAHPQVPSLVFAALCLLILVGVGLPRFRSWQRGRHRPVLDPLQLEELLLGTGALVLDLRDPAAFQRGHIRGAMNLSLDQLAARFRTPDPTARRALVLADETDEVSHRAYDLLRARGFDWLYVLKGGMRAWRARSRPLAK
jgi:rhodanese-related sulfurtransferase